MFYHGDLLMSGRPRRAVNFTEFYGVGGLWMSDRGWQAKVLASLLASRC
jgi:hypothetical protein